MIAKALQPLLKPVLQNGNSQLQKNIKKDLGRLMVNTIFKAITNFPEENEVVAGWDLSKVKMKEADNGN